MNKLSLHEHPKQVQRFIDFQICCARNHSTLQCRLGVQQAAAGLPPHQFSALLPIAFANLASQPDPSSPLHTLCLQHVVFFVFHHFPDNLLSGLDLALEGCNTNSTPSSLLDAIVDKLEANDYLRKKSSFDLGAAKADDCARTLAKRLDEARTKLPTFYAIWSRYMDSLTRLAQLFLFVPIRDGYEPNQPVTVLQRECYEYFARVAAVFSPLIAPYSPTHPPFSPSHENQAMLVLDRFIEFLSALHFNSSIPPGMQNIQSLVWQYYYEKLSFLTHGTQHYYDVLERQLIRLNWQAFWPSKHAIISMETCLDMRSPDCASFVSQIVARIPWSSILQSMHEDSRPSYMASLFGVLVRLVASSRNYNKVRASLLELIKSLSLRTDWNRVSPEDAATIATAVSKSLPSDSLPNPAEIISVIQVIWRKICCLVVREPFSHETLQKQTIWIRTECALLLKADTAKIPAAYNSLISDINALTLNHSNLREFGVVIRELTALWKNITDSKLGESLVTLWTEYLSANPTSPLVLSSTSTIIDSLNSDQLTTALKVVEKTIGAYFLRTDSTWAELLQWIQFPNGRLKSIKSYLMTVPSTENKVIMLPLTLKVFMDYGGAVDNNFFELHHYVVSIRPKHVNSESGFVCLLARLIQWMAARSPTLPTHFAATDDLLPPLIRFLSKASKDESSFLTALISSKKTSHSQKLRVVLQILELYLTQQTIGDGKRPRCEANSPVLNSRISTLKELAQHKSNQNMSVAFNKATVYFVQVDTHHIQSAAKMLLEIGRTTFGDRFLCEV
uniref:Epg5-like central TPR repeats domain-containing protein n=2 Tax=Caenorhabditis japonica TaxID=281687 RepID=A0A8R1DUU1_CAEJA